MPCHGKPALVPGPAWETSLGGRGCYVSSRTGKSRSPTTLFSCRWKSAREQTAALHSRAEETSCSPRPFDPGARRLLCQGRRLLPTSLQQVRRSLGGCRSLSRPPRPALAPAATSVRESSNPRDSLSCKDPCLQPRPQGQGHAYRGDSSPEAGAGTSAARRLGLSVEHGLLRSPAGPGCLRRAAWGTSGVSGLGSPSPSI